jgi:hypothetical protein
MTTFDEITLKIIQEQESIIGPIAWQEARKVQGMVVADQAKKMVSVRTENPGGVIDALVAQYEHLFGRASREASKDAVASMLADLDPSQIPLSLA